MASVQQPFETGRNGLASILGGFANMGRKAQEIAGEFAKMSEENIGAGSKAAERLRDAKSLQDVTSIQTDLMKESYETMNAHYRKIAEIAASTPKELAQNYHEFLSVVADAGSEATQKAAEMGRYATDKAADMSRSATEKGAATAQKTVDTLRETARR